MHTESTVAGQIAHAVPPEDLGAMEASRLDPLEQESLMLNLDAALRVHARHQFFGWTQGALQSLIPHDLLICGLRSSEPVSFYVESFSALTLDLNRVNELFRQDAALVPHLIKSWQKNRRQPLLSETAGDGSLASSGLARELTRVGATSVLAHGTYDVSGKLGSFFIFACRPGAAGARQAYLAELVVPFLHSAWVRSQLSWTSEEVTMKPQVAGLLTARELEIMKWLYYGKSNMEIGMILSISPLTVKNHVQKILRKLNVVNRTQAIGKALTLPILTI